MSTGTDHRDPRRARLALAAVAALLLTAAFALQLSDRRAPGPGTPAVARQTRSRLQRFAEEIQATVERQSAQATLQGWERAHHMLPGPAPAGRPSPAAAAATRVIRRWLAGYLPYEVDRLSAAGRQELLATSSPRLAGSLLAHPPLIPPTQQRHPPPQGRTVNLITTLGPGPNQARAYVEVAYGLERLGFHLTLLDRATRGWLVTGFQG
jgi:hypothetical protein